MEEITAYFEALSRGGKVISPLKTEFWGGTFGQLEDKFGFQWMLNYDESHDRLPIENREEKE